ncbi:MAG: LD-carboxypeptidase [Ignavibacteria bacterium]|nr:LD-carboxypeptidase [Ignavibacteria bacterium]
MISHSYNKPPCLYPGDTIGFISPASSPDDLTRIEKAQNYFAQKGFAVKLGDYLGQYFGYLAGSDDMRLSDLHKMYNDDEVKAIFCLRGGYGSGRLLNRIDYSLIRRHPKIFVGYSDITSLHNAFQKKANQITFAGPMPAVDFSGQIAPYTEKVFWEMVTKIEPGYEIPVPEGWKTETLKAGTVDGPLLGGNLATLVALLGSDYLPDFAGSILYIEDVSEQPYRIDRMLNQLKLSGILDKVNGIILGQITDSDSNTPSRSFTMEQVFDQYFGKLRKPILWNFPHGHIKDIATMPHGAHIELNAGKGKITLLESPVR